MTLNIYTYCLWVQSYLGFIIPPATSLYLQTMALSSQFWAGPKLTFLGENWALPHFLKMCPTETKHFSLWKADSNINVCQFGWWFCSIQDHRMFVVGLNVYQFRLWQFFFFFFAFVYIFSKWEIVVFHNKTDGGLHKITMIWPSLGKMKVMSDAIF